MQESRGRIGLNALLGLAFVLLAIFLIGKKRTTHDRADEQAMQPRAQVPATERINS